MSSSQCLSEAASLSSSAIPTGPPLLLPPLSLLPIVEGEAGLLSRRRSLESDDSAHEKQRSSTAARRASHNAVERERRDKLNARISELASLLPNLAGVRRPSRMAITRSSIAYVHSSRRHRSLASYQLRALHAEAEALRAEVNQWRNRAAVPSVLEPRRGDGFMRVLTGAEFEFDSPVDVYDDDEFDEHYTNAMFSHPSATHHYSPSYPQQQSPFAYDVSPPSSSSGFSSPHSTPPLSTTFHIPEYAANAKFDGPSREPVIVSPIPANPFEAQHFILKTEDEWAIYAPPPTSFAEQVHTW